MKPMAHRPEPRARRVLSEAVECLLFLVVFAGILVALCAVDPATLAAVR
jgi:hypothetical protein